MMRRNVQVARTTASLWCPRLYGMAIAFRIVPLDSRLRSARTYVLMWRCARSFYDPSRAKLVETEQVAQRVPPAPINILTDEFSAATLQLQP